MIKGGDDENIYESPVEKKKEKIADLMRGNCKKVETRTARSERWKTNMIVADMYT